MRIDLNPKTPELPENKGPSRPNSSNRVSPGESERSPDQTSLAGHARVRELQAQIQQLPEDRQSRVEALARAVHDGQYQVSAEQIAQALFSEMVAKAALI